MTLLAVDGGNWKTHLALVREDGAVLALARGPESSPHLVGEDGCVAVIEALLEQARRDAGLPAGGGPLAEVAEVMLAGADLPAEERRLQDVVGGRGWARHAHVANDTFAVLRAGTERGWGVAVVCGAGINCVGVAPDGRRARFPALGAITGDWGGGYDVGLAALSAAARSADGRGPRTALEPLVGEHFGLAGAAAVGEAIHEQRLPARRLVELAPLVLGLAAEDAVAGEISERLADEVVAFARVALERLGLEDDAVDVVLGGGLLRAEHGHLAAGIERRLAAVAPRAAIRLTGDPPIVGAALLALDAAAARAANGGPPRPAADARLRAELGAAVRHAEAERTARRAAAGAPVAEARVEAEVGLGLELGLGLGSGAGQDGG
jgi:N-acetylglucosamine kinase-like BadF-type ATPase